MNPLLLALALLFLHSLLNVAPLGADVLKRISAQDFAHEVVEIRGQVWLAMDQGAYRVEGDRLIQVVPQDVLVKTIAEINGRVWLGSSKGLLEAQGDKATPLYEQDLGDSVIMAIHSVGDVVWLGTSSGLIRIEGDALATTTIRERVNTVREVDGRLWVGTQRNAYRLNDTGGFDNVLPGFREVSKIVSAGGDVWLVTNRGLGRYGPCFRFDGVQAETPDRLNDLEVVSVANIGGVPWFATTRGVFDVTGGRPRGLAVNSPIEPINTIVDLGGQIWLGSTRRAYQERDSAFLPIPERAQALNIKGILPAGGSVWMWGSDGVFRVEEGVEIEILPTTRTIFGMEVSFGRLLKIKTAHYHDREGQPQPGSRLGDFTVILEPQRDIFEREVAENRFVPANRLAREYPFWFQDMHFVGRDALGNSTRAETRPVVVLPALRIVVAVLTPIGWWLLALVLLSLAPRWTPLMDLVMLPTVRRAGSFFAIPVALVFAPVRRHLLSRYTRELRESCQTQGWGDLGHLPSDLSLLESKILIELEAQRQSQVTGDLRTSRQYMRFLACRFADDGIRERLGTLGPITIKLERYSKDLEDLERGACLQLANYGGITDLQLAKILLARGGFVFLLDGWGQIDDLGRVAVGQLIDGYGKRNFIVVGSHEEGDDLHPEGELAVSMGLPTVPEVEEQALYVKHDSCFISYSHEDRRFAQRLRGELKSRRIRTWLYEEDVRIGEKILDSVVDAIRRHDKVLLCCSKASLSSQNVDREISAAIEKERKSNRLVVMPLDLDGYLDNWQSGHAPGIRDRLAANFVGWEQNSPQFYQQVQKLVRALERPTVVSDTKSDS